MRSFSTFYALLIILKINFSLANNNDDRPPSIDLARVFPVYFDPPEKPGLTEDGGAMIEMHIWKDYHNKMLIDTLTNVIWIMSNECQDEACQGHNLFTPANPTWGHVEIEYNTGKMLGRNYKVSKLDLKSFSVLEQNILLVDNLGVEEFKGVKFDGVFGLTKYVSFYKNSHYFTSVLENIYNQKLPNYVVLRLGGQSPYLKFGSLDEMDMQYYRVDKTSGQKETIQWAKLYENGKLLLPLKHVKLIFRDSINKAIREEYTVTHCRRTGCISTIDTKSYYIYGPAKQLQDIMKFRAIDCGEDSIQPLPDMEFSFYNIDVNYQEKTSRSTIDLTIEPSDYMIRSDVDKEGNTCVPGFLDHGTQYGWSFGIMFLKKFIMVYDFYNEKIGFVRANNDI